MKTSIWRYELVSATYPSRKREGALFRVEFEPNHFGYSDCHPWPELGDVPLEELLRRKPNFNPLIGQTLHFIFPDHAARSRGRNLFEGLEIPSSHASMPEAVFTPELAVTEFTRLKAAGFQEVKIKAGMELARETGAIVVLARATQELGMKLRLDLNARSDKSEVSQFLRNAILQTGDLKWLDWIEDPCLFEPDDWRVIREEFNVRLAVDFAADPRTDDLSSCVDVIVLKPAVQRYQDVLKRAAHLGLPVCVTSYLDHPVGQCFAAWVAAAAAKQGARLETCGLITHTVYQPNAFSERLGIDGPRLIPPSGTGIGFDDLLENLPWEKLD